MTARARALFARLALVLLLVCRMANADRPDVTARIDATTVGEGEDIHLTLEAQSDGSTAPRDPSPGSTSGFALINLSSGPSQSVTIVNGHVSRKQGLTTTWTLRATKQGTFTLGPCSVSIAGQRVSTQTVRVVVVAPGHAPPRMNPFDPFGMGSAFDPFGGFFGGGIGNDIAPQRPATDPKLSLDAPRGEIAFLHATVDKTSAVVGEQVTLSVYLYVDANEREAQLNDVHEATAIDFVERSLFEDDGTDKHLGRALVGGQLYNAKLLRKWALFPLKSGDLQIGPMSLTLVRRHLGDPVRQSETISIHVTEPPMAGRPAGYVVGDTGNFTLSAETNPRTIDRDGAVGITVELSGTGNLPNSITPPARAGIEWLAPEMHEKMGATAGDKYGGKRTFAYVVRLHKEGALDLGDLTLPFYNPDTRSYAVARAALGVVNVRPGVTPAKAVEPALDPLAALPEARKTLAGVRPAPSHLADAPLFWLGLCATPIAYGVASGASSAVRRIRQARAEKAASPETRLRERMADAASACKGSDPRVADAAVARAIVAATIARVGVNIRDAEGAEVSRRLGDAGVDRELAHRVEELIRDCETARFAPDACEMAAVKERWDAARGVVDALRRGE
jgi:hypothetical protein